jgi:hypothetical protein
MSQQGGHWKTFDLGDDAAVDPAGRKEGARQCAQCTSVELYQEKFYGPTECVMCLRGAPWKIRFFHSCKAAKRRCGYCAEMENMCSSCDGKLNDDESDDDA